MCAVGGEQHSHNVWPSKDDDDDDGPYATHQHTQPAMHVRLVRVVDTNDSPLRHETGRRRWSNERETGQFADKGTLWDSFSPSPSLVSRKKTPSLHLLSGNVPFACQFARQSSKLGEGSCHCLLSIRKKFWSAAAAANWITPWVLACCRCQIAATGQLNNNNRKENIQPAKKGLDWSKTEDREDILWWCPQRRRRKHGNWKRHWRTERTTEAHHHYFKFD